MENSYVYIKAKDLIEFNNFNYDTRLSLIIADIHKDQIYNIKQILENILGKDINIIFNNSVINLKDLETKVLEEVNEIEIKPSTLINKRRYSFSDLCQIMSILRAKNGCPWDIAQTHETIRENLIEESYELIEAINNKDVPNMIEETGDVLLQAVFHAKIGEDNKEYNIEDSLTDVCKKLITRHTHIFGQVKANNAEEALKAWEEAKAKEKKTQNVTQKIDKIANTIPILMKTVKVQKIAKKNNLDFDLDVVSILNNDIQKIIKDKTLNEEDAGKLMFDTVNVLRKYDIDPEVALATSLSKFINKINKMQQKYKSLIDEDKNILKKEWDSLDK